MPIYRLSKHLVFPPVGEAEEGILAVGGDLSVERLLLAYQSGIFPWFSGDEPIIWWSPDPRFVLFPDELKVSKSMQMLLARSAFTVTFDTAFEEVITACSLQLRKGQQGTWITPGILKAYIALHRQGYAHSVEVWEGQALVGGLYGISLGRVFFGESMFHTTSNASKYGFIHLVRWLRRHDFELIDCQVETSHLASLGARNIPRPEFMNLLKMGLNHRTLDGAWSADDLFPAE